jgi:hypothetical protein
VAPGSGSWLPQALKTGPDDPGRARIATEAEVERLKLLLALVSLAVLMSVYMAAAPRPLSSEPATV